MTDCDTLILNPSVIDGTGHTAQVASVAIRGGRIVAVGELKGYYARQIIQGDGLALAPGFIDVHTHDDTAVIRTPGMMAKLSQGVTTVIVGNCGISAAPVRLKGDPPDPMNLLGDEEAFRYPTFASYIAAIHAARPAVNVAALVGHTALRNNHMDQLDRAATEVEILAMRVQLIDALDHGALGLSSGLAYMSANSAPAEEISALAHPLAGAGAVYTTHMRSEAESIRDAIDETLDVGGQCNVPVIISHLKCSGIANWGRSAEILESLNVARTSQAVGWDCYPYAAGSSTLNLRQVDERVLIQITWSKSHPEMGGRALAEIAGIWNVEQMEAARRLQPAGAIYHSISEEDMLRILRHPATMIGSDGLPGDPMPHPRLWGTFPRVLGHCCRDRKLFSLPEAVYKMTGMPAQRFSIADRGLIHEGYCADLVMFNPETVRDTATFANPISPAVGIEAVWVNGTLAYRNGSPTPQRSGRFLPRLPGTHHNNFSSLRSYQ